MIPDRRWFPGTLEQRAAWYANFKAQLLAVAGTLGLVADDTDPIVNDNLVMQFLLTATTTVNAYDDGVRAFRKAVTEGDIGDPNPVFPANPALTAPAGSTVGIFERLDALVKRIRTLPAYTEEIGALLGIIPSASGGPVIPVGDQVPVLKASVDPGHVIEIKFTRGNSDGIYIEKNVNNGGWAFAEKAFKSPAVFAVPGDGIPQGVQLRARFVEGNSPVGDWSDIVTVQTIP